MNRKSLFLASCLGLAALLAPSSAEAIRCYCDFGGYQASQNWGMGATCTDANNDLRAHLLSEAAAFCDPSAVCAFTVSYTTSCWQPTPTTWQADGFATFGCRVCDGGFIP